MNDLVVVEKIAQQRLKARVLDGRLFADYAPGVGAHA